MPTCTGPVCRSDASRMPSSATRRQVGTSRAPRWQADERQHVRSGQLCCRGAQLTPAWPALRADDHPASRRSIALVTGTAHGWLITIEGLAIRPTPLARGFVGIGAVRQAAVPVQFSTNRSRRRPIVDPGISATEHGTSVEGTIARTSSSPKDAARYAGSALGR